MIRNNLYDCGSLVLVSGMKGDGKNAAFLHKREIPSLLSCASSKTIELFYENVVDREKTIFKVIRSEEKLVGFYLVTMDEKFSYLSILLSKPISFFKALLVSPSTFIMLCHAAVKKKSVPSVMPKDKLLYLVVNPDCRGEGVGRLLLQDVFEVFRSYGIKKFGVHVESDNKKALQFYKAMGGDIVSTFTPVDKEVSIVCFIL